MKSPTLVRSSASAGGVHNSSPAVIAYSSHSRGHQPSCLATVGAPSGGCRTSCGLPLTICRHDRTAGYVSGPHTRFWIDGDCPGLVGFDGAGGSKSPAVEKSGKYLRNVIHRVIRTVIHRG